MSGKAALSQLIVLVLAFLPLAAHAEIPLPRPRPDPALLATQVAPLPQPRMSEAPPPELDAETPEEVRSADPVPPPAPPPAIYQAACPAVFNGDVIGEMLPPIAEGTCRVASPLSISAVRVGENTVPLSSPATLTCPMAGQLVAWVRRVSAYADVMFKSPVAEIISGTSYFCRPRNNEPGAKFSEHAFANAIDVVGFRLEDGSVISLPDDWQGMKPEARTMRYAHDAACGLFTTTLGPEANALHKDHLHLDLGCHGSTCTYRMCE